MKNCKKNNKTNYYGNIRNIRQCRHNPQNNQNNIVCGVGKGKTRISSEREINCNETCCDGKCTRQNIGGVEEAQNEIKYHRYNNGQNEHKNGFFAAYTVNGNLCFFAFIGISEPRNKSEKSHGTRHAEICYHFAVIGK